MTPESRLGRLSGFLYLIVVITGMFSLGYVPSQLSVHNDPQATFDRIVASESLFRYGITSLLIEQVSYLLLVLVLFRLLRAVDQNIAAIMVALVAVSVPVAMISVAHRLDVLTLLDQVRSGSDTAQLALQVKALLKAYGNGLLVTSLFWGLWLFPFGFLVFKSGFLPKVLGVFLMLGCTGYVVDVFCSVLSPHYPDMAMANYMTLPAAIGEIGTCLWLLVFGARKPFGAKVTSFPTTL